MEQNQQYTEIVKRFADPHGEFFQHFRSTLKKYRPTLPDDNINDLYQESFLAAQKNLREGRIRENTAWNSYLISIGLNLATHEYRQVGRFDGIEPNNDYSDEVIAEYNTPEVQSVFGEVLSFMNEKCRKILEWTLYIPRLSNEEIAAAFNSTPRSIITQRNRCKNKLVEMVKAKLVSMGYKVKSDEK